MLSFEVDSAAPIFMIFFFSETRKSITGSVRNLKDIFHLIPFTIQLEHAWELHTPPSAQTTQSQNSIFSAGLASFASSPYTGALKSSSSISFPVTGCV